MIDLHVCLDEKITRGDISYVRQNFPVQNHPFLIFGHTWGFDYSGYENVEQVNDDLAGLRTMAAAMKKADRVHLHGLFSLKMVVLLALRTDLAAKCNWFIWGDDLYTMIRKKSNLAGKLHIATRKRAVRNFYSVATNVSGDWKLLEKTLNKKVRFFPLGFTAGALGNVAVSTGQKAPGEPVNILLGNSATPTNCHIDALEKLAHLKDSNIRIYTPLSYGSDAYADMITQKGKEIFGDKFIPMRDFMPAEEYFKLLGSIDAAVMAHDRQQAMGNIVPLLYAGKRVYLRRDITTWECLQGQYGLELFPYEMISHATAEELASGVSDFAKQREKCELMADDSKALALYRKMLISETPSDN